MFPSFFIVYFFHMLETVVSLIVCVKYSSAYSHHDKADVFCWLTFLFADRVHSQPQASHSLRNHTHSQHNGLCLTGRCVALTHSCTHTALIEQSVTTDGSQPCRCLCVLPLSIMNKDLLFFLIESYEWRVAHEAEPHTKHVEMKICFDSVSMVSALLFPHSHWWSMVGAVWCPTGGVCACMHACVMCVCVFLCEHVFLCIFETFGASLVYALAGLSLPWMW